MCPGREKKILCADFKEKQARVLEKSAKFLMKQRDNVIHRVHNAEKNKDLIEKDVACTGKQMLREKIGSCRQKCHMSSHQHKTELGVT